jgi:hypothetical protein
MTDPGLVFKTKTNAVTPRDASALRASSDRPQRSTARRPLGLAPVLADEPERDLDPIETAQKIVAAAVATLSDEALDACASVRTVFEIAVGPALEFTLQCVEDTAKLSRELAAAASTIAEMRKELTALQITVARLEGAASARADLRAGGIIRP